MKCTNCGFESDVEFTFCPGCGAGAQPQPTAADKILCALKDKLFLVICILISATCLMSLAADSLPLITILTTIFLWLTYAQSCKGVADAKHLRCVSGTVFAQYVLNYVIAGVLLVVGLILCAAFTFIASDPALIDGFLSEFMDTTDSYAIIAEVLATISGGLILFLFLLIAAVIVILNVFSIRYIHRFAKSVYQSIEANTLALKHVKGAQVWLFVFSAFTAISALSSLFSGQFLTGITSALSCATELIAGLLIGKYFSSAE